MRRGRRPASMRPRLARVAAAARRPLLPAAAAADAVATASRAGQVAMCGLLVFKCTISVLL
jgi:hypothetical protein